jgi:1-acyl-sn-glycerol-3-phosphate acyltransferase
MTDLRTMTDYFIDPAYVADISERLLGGLESGKSIEVVSRIVSPLLADEIQVDGIEQVPSEGPIVIIKNHPFHFDALTIGELFSKRPDVKWLMKATVNIPVAEYPNLLIIERKEGKIVRRDAERVKRHLSGGGSMIATPWGALDHEAYRYASIERANQNVCNYVRFAGATIIPVQINQERYPDATLPVRRVEVRFGTAIESKHGQPDEAAIGHAVEQIYPHKTVF